MRPKSVFLLVTGSLVALVALALFTAGGLALWAHTTQRDDAGYFRTPTVDFDTPTYALTSAALDLHADGGGGDWARFNLGSARVRVEPTGGEPIFVGVGPSPAVQRYLADVEYDEITDVSETSTVDRVRHDGGAPPMPPGEAAFWLASASGPDIQTLTWDVESGEWTVVIMNAEGRPGVAVEASAGFKTGVLRPIGVGLLAAGLVAAAAALAMIIGGAATRRDRSTATHRDDVPPSPPSAYPLRLDGVVDASLSRGMWLVKWFLAIPHVVVLAVLWTAFAVLTLVAGLAILFTGRYPRGIFHFNVGVLRWTWRVTFYAFTLATDRYPPFSLDPDPGYPADVSVAYPTHLSRPLVLVKWWLLAIPHYLVLAVFGGSITLGTATAGGASVVLAAGLIGLLVMIAAVALLFTSRFPGPIFDFVMGMQRWTYRVVAYACLMYDEYPPFRLDTGGIDPGSYPAPPAPAPDDRGELVGV